MQDYALFTDVSGLSGVGVCPDTSRTTMSDDVWAELITSKPKHEKRLEEFRQSGFAHRIICSELAGMVVEKPSVFDAMLMRSLVPGDARATGESASDIAAYASTLGATVGHSTTPTLCARPEARSGTGSGGSIADVASPPSAATRVQRATETVVACRIGSRQA
ncbi:unnamed protein product [Phytophthora fragariaefolia]|uniref:Unnamed protein product n=1 Tax=Phytophthora fragariaefolia TaxID=1490495 RepID=A0A9W6U7C1_9STRA|nr:unnamed protein product [Phytophthora fragariaefolia]